MRGNFVKGTLGRQFRQWQGKKSIYSCCSVSSSVAANLKVSPSQVPDGVASKSQIGFQCTSARRSTFWWFSAANQCQRNTARRILEQFVLCSAFASADSGMQQNAFQLDDWSVPVQWGQVVEHTGHQHRARARLCGHLGNLGSAFSAPMGKINHHILSA